MHVVPAIIPARAPGLLVRMRAALFEPSVDVVVVELLGPQHAGEGLAHHVGRISIQRGGDYVGIEFVCFLSPGLHDRVKGAAKHPSLRGGHIRQPQPDSAGFARRDCERIVSRSFGPRLLGIHGISRTMDDEVVDPVFDVRGSVDNPEKPLGVRFILGEEQIGRVFGVKVPHSEARDARRQPKARSARAGLINLRPDSVSAPGPHIAEPERRQHVERCRFRAAVAHCDLNQDIFCGSLRVFDEHIKVAILIEDTRVQQLVLELPATCDVGSWLPVSRRDRPTAGTYRGTSCTNGWEWSPE